VPTYQYQCADCGEALEIRQSFSDDALTECPTCGGRLRKVFNAVGVVFKGSGFYRNDSRGADPSTSSTSTSSESTSTSTDTKSTKPASTDSGSTSTPAKGASKPAS
jgi:putative FmdB family regulatory protein